MSSITHAYMYDFFVYLGSTLAPSHLSVPIKRFLYSSEAEVLRKTRDAIVNKLSFTEDTDWGFIVWNRENIRTGKVGGRTFTTRASEDASAAIIKNGRMGNFNVNMSYVSNSLSHVEAFEAFLYTNVLNRQFEGRTIAVPVVSTESEEDLSLTLQYSVSSPDRETSNLRRLSPEAGSLFAVDFVLDFMGLILSPLDLS